MSTHQVDKRMQVIGLCGMFLLAAGSTPGFAASDCSSVPALTVVVLAEHHPPTIMSNYTHAKLREMAARAGSRSAHPPFGFYSGTFGYTVDVDTEPGASGTCIASMRVTVRMLIGNRRIEVGTGGPCRPEAVAAHYVLHAGGDDRLLTRYGRLASEMFDRMPQADILGGPATGDRQGAVTTMVRRAMDELLNPFSEDRARALAAADTNEELRAFQRACGRAT